MSSKHALVATSLAVCSASASWLAGSGKHPVYAREAVAGVDQGYENVAVRGVAGYVLNPIILAADGQLAAKVETKPLVYRVQKGDILSRIGDMFGFTYQTLAAFNHLPDPDVLKVGQEIRIPLVRKWIPLKAGDTVESLAEEYKVSTWLILHLNPQLRDPGAIQEGQLVAVPQKLEVPKPTPVRSLAEVRNQKKQRVRLANSPDLSQFGPHGLRWPVSGRITSKFGWRGGRQHKGIDIWSSAGAQALIRAAKSGVVIEAGYSGNYGNLVVIDHGGGWVTCYGHLSRILVSKGEKVGTGQVIGNMGKTGNATGYHLHFEVRKDGKAINPLSVLR
jgi:murein DD-endopeptidase MepM/ murein hydrolase activator NlpD